jgi:hypothetical protein
MAGARKRVYQHLHTGGRDNSKEGTEHGSLSPGQITPGGKQLNQMAPALHVVGTSPEDGGQYDENFAHRNGEGEKDS